MSGFDIPFLLMQSGLLVALVFLPVFVVAGFSPTRRWAVPLVLTCGLIGWALAFYLAVGHVGLAVGQAGRYLPSEAPDRKSVV